MRDKYIIGKLCSIDVVPKVWKPLQNMFNVISRLNRVVFKSMLHLKTQKVKIYTKKREFL